MKKIGLTLAGYVFALALFPRTTIIATMVAALLIMAVENGSDQKVSKYADKLLEATPFAGHPHSLGLIAIVAAMLGSPIVALNYIEHAVYAIYSPPMALLALTAGLCALVWQCLLLGCMAAMVVHGVLDVARSFSHP